MSFWGAVTNYYLLVGIPALVTYSLAITAFNRTWLGGRSQKFHRIAKIANMRDRHPGFRNRPETVERLFAEGQQVPIPLFEEGAQLSSLPVLPEHDH